MRKQEVSLLLMNKVVVSIKKEKPIFNVSKRYVMTFNANLMTLGFMLSPDVVDACVKNLTKEEFIEFAEDIQELLIQYNGSRANMKPMYPDFPEQVMNMDEVELHSNALIHYYTNGEWLPKYEEKVKLRTKSIIKPKLIGLTDDKEIMSYIKKLAETPISMSQQQKDIFKFLVEEYGKNVYPSTYIIPNKENMAFIIHTISQLDLGEKHIWHKHLANWNVKTITDVLRLAAIYLGGDPTLASEFRLKSIKREDRRFLLGLIDSLYEKNVAQVEEDTARYQVLWINVLEQLHPGDYAKRYVYANQFATKVRENKLKGWHSKLERAYAFSNLERAVRMLEKRPGEFARHLERTIRKAYEYDTCEYERALNIIERFSAVAKDVDRTILLQLTAYFKDKAKNGQSNVRTFFPKGNACKVYVIEEERTPIPRKIYSHCRNVCLQALSNIYSEREELGKIYVDPQVYDFTVPLKLRNASSQLQTVSRGSRMKLPENTNIIRLYTWWQNLIKGSENWENKVDIDLSATFYDKDFETIVSEVSYYNLRIDGVAHSGDIVSAPNGAAEFINIDINTLLEQNVRYVAMNINSFNDNNFCDIPECFAGVMALDELNDVEKTFDPAKSFVRSYISTESTICIPMVFDLETKEVIWLDTIIPRYNSAPNNVATCKDSVTNIVRGLVTASYPTLFDLICFNLIARNGELVENKEDADIVFSLDEGITPFNLEILNSEWV